MHTVEQKQECSKFLFCIINKQRTCLVTYTIIQLVNTYGLGSFYKIWVFNPNFYWEEIKVGVKGILITPVLIVELSIGLQNKISLALENARGQIATFLSIR